MCASCGKNIGMTWGQSLLTAIPVPVGLAAGFLVPSGEDKLLLWTFGVVTMFVLYARWGIKGRLSAARLGPDHV